jgi:hypothetical protein
MLDHTLAVGDLVLGVVPEQLFHARAKVVHHVLEVSDTVVHRWLPLLELCLRGCHLLHGSLEISNPLQVLSQQCQDLPKLFFGHGHRYLTPGAVKIGQLACPILPFLYPKPINIFVGIVLGGIT